MKKCKHPKVIHAWITDNNGVKRVIRRRCDHCGEQLPFKEPSNDAQVENDIKVAWGIAHLTTNLARPLDAYDNEGVAQVGEFADAHNDWPWDPTRPLAGQYEEWQARIAEQTRHDVAASVVRHAQVDEAKARRDAQCAACGTSDGCSKHEMFTCVSCGALVSWADGGPPDEDGLGGDECSNCYAARTDNDTVTVTIDSDFEPGVQINGINTQGVAPLLTPNMAEQLADDLMLGADAARQARCDGYHGPAVVVELEVEAAVRTRPHIVNGEFQSDKYPTTPRGKVPLSTKDPTAQDLLWEYVQRRRAVDAEFASDLEEALRLAGYDAQMLVG